MIETKILRENIEQMLDELLLQSGLREKIEDFLNSEEVKGNLNNWYDRMSEYINQVRKEIHELVPETQNEKEQKAFETIPSKESFIEKHEEKIKVTTVSAVLHLLANTTDEVFLKEIEALKNDKQILFKLNDGVVKGIIQNIFDEYKLTCGILEQIPDDDYYMLDFLLKLTYDVFVSQTE